MKKIAVLMTILLVAFGTQLYGQPNEARALHKVMAKLNLTDDQKKEIEKIHVDAAKQRVATKAKLETGRIELQQLLKADTPDKSAIEKKVHELADITVQMRLIKLNSWFAINKLLTPDQQKVWKKVLENAPRMTRQRFMNRMGRRPMPAQQFEHQMEK
jgi:Spy/CpxP family protein refolding chaperone